ncbi:MAG: TIGR00282 family metallophosphoesterase [Bacilli bacterium]|nr:TIGR00282 family metallophosphoesterase [Bacilli bacterium]
MKVLFFGDIVGRIGRNAVKHFLPSLVKKYQPDFVIANGENATHGKGLIEKHYNELIDAGVDAITLGNHYMSKNDINNYIDRATCLIRPLNLINDFGGVGSQVFDVNGIKVRVTNILGVAFMKQEVNSPYLSLKELLDENEEDVVHIVDFHAEATGEKLCFGNVFDGQVSAVVCTHTHVQTNDARVLEHGTAYISDVGMCGAANGVLGFDKETVIGKTIFGSDQRFEINQDDKEMVNAVLIDIDDENKLAKSIITINLVGDSNGK